MKEAAREISSPKQRSWALVKNIARYLKGKPRLILEYPWQEASSEMQTYSDSDYAGCVRTRKSTTGGCMMIGRHLLK